MSLDKQTVSVPLIDGLGDDDDIWGGDPPGFITLDNARFGREKVLGKRFGLEIIAANIAGANAAREPNCVVDLDGAGHLISADGTFRQNLVSGNWEAMNLGALPAARVVSDPLVRQSGSSAKSDAAVAGTIVCAVWEQLDGGGGHSAWYGFWDISTDVPRPIAGPKQFTTITEACRVVAVQTNGLWSFLATGLNTDVNGNIYKTLVSAGVGSSWTFPAPTLIDQVSNNHYGLCADDSGLFAYLCYLDFAGPFRSLRKIDATGAIVATRSLANVGTQHVLHDAPNATVYVIGPGGDIQRVADTLAGAVTTFNPFTAPASGAYTNKFFRASIGRADTTGNLWAARSTSGPENIGVSPYGTQFVQIDANSNAASGQVLIGGIVLTAHFSRYIDSIGTCLVGVGQQATSYTADSDPTAAAATQREGFKAAPIGYLAQPLAGGFLRTWGRYGQDGMELFGNDAIGTPAIGAASSHLPHLATFISANVPAGVISAYPVRFGVDFFGGLRGNVRRAVDLMRATVHNVRPMPNVNAQSLRLMGGGAGTSVIDGVSHNELTPPAPEWICFDGYDAAIGQVAGSTPHINVAGSPWGGGPNPNRQWGFVVVWQYTDARGNIHRGPPSSIAWTTLPMLMGAGTNPGKLVFSPWNPTALLGDKVLPVAQIYACPFDGRGDFRLLGTVVPKVDTTVDEGRVFVDILSNAGAPPTNSVYLSTWDSLQPVPRSLFTTSFGGSDLSPWPSPALLSLCSTESRLWGLNAEDRLDVWYTKPIALGYAPEWSETLRVRVPQDGGPGVGIAALDDKVVVFKQRKLFIIEGDPGDAAGNSSSLRSPRLVSGDVGCASVNSIVEGPFGVIFMSEKGFTVLGRDLQVTFIGIGTKVLDEVLSGSTRLSVISSALIPSESEVRFVLDVDRGAGMQRVLRWNYLYNRWTRADQNAPTFNAVVDGREIGVLDIGGAGNTITRETPNLWVNLPGSGPLLKMRSAWIKLNGIAGFGRMWRAVFVFRWFGGSEITIKTAQDYLAETETLKEWSTAELAAIVSSTNLVELDIRPTVQKCQSVQFIIEEVLKGGTPSGRGFELVGCTIECGVKKGANKRLGAAARK